MEIVGAESASYDPVAADVGRRLKVLVSFIDGDGVEETRESELTDVVESGVSGAPEITGTPQVGQALEAGLGDLMDPNGLPSTFPDDYELQWEHVDADGESNPQDIAGATSDTYPPVASDVGKRIRVRVTYTDGASIEKTVWSEATAAVVAMQEDCATDRADADWCTTMTVGVSSGSVNRYGYHDASGFNPETFGKLDNGAINYGDRNWSVDHIEYVDYPFTDEDSFSIRLDSSFAPRGSEFDIGGTFELTADADSEEPDPGDYTWDVAGPLTWLVGQKVTVSLRFGSFPATGQPGIEGRDPPALGQELTATIDAIADLDGRTKADADDPCCAFTYQWVRIDGATSTPITGATSSTYAPVDDDLDKTLKVEVSFTDDRGNPEGPLASAETEAVIDDPNLPPVFDDGAETTRDARGDGGRGGLPGRGRRRGAGDGDGPGP